MWKKLTYQDLRLVLSEDEYQSLETISVSSTIQSVVNDCINIVADTWRGSWQSKGYSLDERDHYVAPEYIYYVLVHARQAVWSRFPNSGIIAIDEVRKEEYRQALEFLKNPSIATSKPDYSDDPILESAMADVETKDASIVVPPLRFPYWMPYGNNVEDYMTTPTVPSIIDKNYPQTMPEISE